MRIYVRLAWLVVVVVLSGVGLTGAQEPPSESVAPTPAPPAKAVSPKEGAPVLPPKSPDELQDPTQPSPRMREVIGTKSGPGPASKVAAISVRARVIARNKPPLAVLDVEGRLYTISKGSVVAGPNNTVLKILELSSTEVRVEVSPQKEVLLLR